MQNDNIKEVSKVVQVNAPMVGKVLSVDAKVGGQVKRMMCWLLWKL